MTPEIIKNPFDGWLESQKTTGAFARNKDGHGVSANDPEACAWCAAGWLFYKNLEYNLTVKFNGFLMDRFELEDKDEDNGLIYVNDVLNLRPAIFRALWEEFAKSKS